VEKMRQKGARRWQESRPTLAAAERDEMRGLELMEASSTGEVSDARLRL